MYKFIYGVIFFLVIQTNSLLHAGLPKCAPVNDFNLKLNSVIPYTLPEKCIQKAQNVFIPTGDDIEISSGVKYKSFYWSVTGAAPLSRVFTLKVDLNKATMDVTRPADRMQTTSDFGKAYECDVAVNGTQFNIGKWRKKDKAALWGWGSGGRSSQHGQGVSWGSFQAYRPGDVDNDGRKDSPFYFAIINGRPEIGNTNFNEKTGSYTLPSHPDLLFTGREKLVKTENNKVIVLPFKSNTGNWWTDHIKTAQKKYAWLAIGITNKPDGKEIVIAAVEHVNGEDEGVTFQDFAILMKYLGAINAIYMEGGGSVAMYIRDIGLVNRIKNKEPERVVSNHIGFNCRNTGRISPLPKYN